jgi:hypothetical protein
MSRSQIHLNLQALCANTELRFLFMLTGVLIVPLVIFMSAANVSLSTSGFYSIWGYAALGLLLLAGLSLGLLRFNRKLRSLSIQSAPAPYASKDEDVI